MLHSLRLSSINSRIFETAFHFWQDSKEYFLFCHDCHVKGWQLQELPQNAITCHIKLPALWTDNLTREGTDGCCEIVVRRLPVVDSHVGVVRAWQSGETVDFIAPFLQWPRRIHFHYSCLEKTLVIPPLDQELSEELLRLWKRKSSQIFKGQLRMLSMPPYDSLFHSHHCMLV